MATRRRRHSCPTCWARSLGSVSATPISNRCSNMGRAPASGGFLYSCDSYADDLPYWIKGAAGPHLVIPYSLDANDMRFVNPQGFGGGDEFFTYLKDSFDVLYAEGETAPKMMSIGLHCRVVGRPGRAASLMRFLHYVFKHDPLWVPP